MLDNFFVERNHIFSQILDAQARLVFAARAFLWVEKNVVFGIKWPKNHQSRTRDPPWPRMSGAIMKQSAISRSCLPKSEKEIPWRPWYLPTIFTFSSYRETATVQNQNTTFWLFISHRIIVKYVAIFLIRSLFCPIFVPVYRRIIFLSSPGLNTRFNLFSSVNFTYRKHSCTRASRMRRSRRKWIRVVTHFLFEEGSEGEIEGSSDRKWLSIFPVECDWWTRRSASWKKMTDYGRMRTLLIRVDENDKNCYFTTEIFTE